jgi:hypothetical protein
MKASWGFTLIAGGMLWLTGCKPAEVKTPEPSPSPVKSATSAVTPRPTITILLPPAEGPAYVTVEPFVGVKLDLPRDWHAVDSESTDPATPSTPVVALVGKPGFAGPRASWSFVPASHSGAELNIALNPQPSTTPARNTGELSQETIDALAKSFSEALEPIVEGRGYRLKRRASWKRVKINDLPAVLWQDEAESPAGILAAQVLFIPLEKASIIATFLWTKTPGNTWEPAIERAQASLRVTDSAGRPKP